MVQVVSINSSSGSSCASLIFLAVEPNSVGLRCKDKNNDLGFQTLQVDEAWSFKFHPNPAFDTSPYYCYFTWLDDTRAHYFTIYYYQRDRCSFCSWEVHETGCCKVLSDLKLDCWKWDKVEDIIDKNNNNHTLE
ncbi:hypothetical protein PIB30_072429 [Stylosanthes scabra]|uniref:S-protein homolog n=1 Tax=Stylosanthes scabra TaxID=79078 RepID=A0ABU6YLN0_9FABA|nr:hypothetical protein [Stylosanthes scabra]